MNKRKMRSAASGIAMAAITGGIGILAVAGSGESPASAGPIPMLPRVALPARGPVRAEWSRRSAHVTALSVDLDAPGAHTHGNWIFFRMPFDTTDQARIKEVRVEPGATFDPDVAAIRLGTLCAPWKRYGAIGTWAGYTAGAVGPTLSFAQHPTPPTDDPMIFGLNVPSRVANYVACGWDKSAVLRDPATWHLDVTWEER